MATVIDYLNKKREEDPSLSGLSYLGVYNKLQEANDPYLPKWEMAAPSAARRTGGQTSYQRKADPDFVNSLFDWGDWGINDNSARWAQSAYNNSITGLSYQYYNGEQRFNLDGYNPGIAEDVFSAVLSFMMPMDFATMWAGGLAGKGLSSLAGYGMRTAATENLVKLGVKEGAKKAIGKKIVKETAEDVAAREAMAKVGVQAMIQENGYSALLGSFAPKAAGAIGSATTLATFEGVRGGMQAAVDDEDVWAGIGHGVMHGGIMGGLIGAVGASINVKHAKLFNKKKKGTLTPSEEKQLGFWRTGKGGQVLTEAGIFTSPEVKNLITDEDYTFRDLFRSFATNVGMIGTLKVQHHLMAKGKKSLDEYWEGEGKQEVQRENQDAQSKKSVAEDLGIDVSELGETPAQEKSRKEIDKEVSRFQSNAFKNSGKKESEYETWEAKYDQALKDIERINDGKIDLSKTGEKELQNIYENIQAVYGAMSRNIGSYKKDNPEFTNARKAKLAEMEKLKKDWKEKIIDPLNNVEKVKKKSEKFSDAERLNLEVKFDKALQDAKAEAKKGNKVPLEILTEGLEGYDPATGRVKKEALTADLKERVDVYLEARQETGVAPEKIIKKTKVEEFEADVGPEGALKLKTVDEVSSEIKEIVSTDTRKAAEKLNNKDSAIQDSTPFKLDVKNNAYNKSKSVLAYMARKFLPNSKGGDKGGQLGHMDKLAKHMADKGKSLFDLTDAEIKDFLKANKSTPQASITKLLNGLSELRDLYGRDLFTNFKEFKWLAAADKPGQVGGFLKKIKIEAADEGLQQPTSETSAFKFKKNEISIIGKAQEYVKFITDKLHKGFKNLMLKAKTKPEIAGHKDYLAKDNSGMALTTKDISEIVRQFFGKRVFEKGAAGEGRLFRKAIEQWAAEKYPGNADIRYIVDKLIIGHAGKDMVETYSQSFPDKASKKRAVQKILKEYLEDITKNNYKTKKDKAGYSTQEIAAGLKLLKSHKGDIIFKDSKGNKRSIDKATVETIFQYMIETGPRLNEIAPSPESLRASIKYAKEVSEKIDYQVLDKLKTAEAVIEATDLNTQVKWVKKKYPQLVVQMHKKLGKHKGDLVLGQIQGQLIKIAQGKARIDTLPHEVSHHVVDALRAAGDPFSKKLVEQGINMFRKKGMSKAQAEEAFVEALGRYSAKTLNKSMMGRMRSWVSRTWNHFKQYFGITNKRDVQQMQKEIVSIVGGKVLSGKIPTDFLPLESRIKVKYQTSDTKAGKKIIEKVNNRVHALETQLVNELGYNKKELRELSKEIIGKDTWKLSEINVGELEAYESRLKALAQGTIIEGKSKKSSLNHAKVKDLEIQYDITDAQREAFFKTYNTTLENANDFAIKSYKSYIIKGNEIQPLNNTAAESNLALIEGTKMPSISIFGRMVMRSSDVIRKYGGKPGERIAELLDAHDFTRSTLKGEGEVVVKTIKNMVDKKTAKHYMHLLDPGLAKGAVKQLKEMAADTNLPKELRNKYKQELKETEDAVNNFSEGGRYYQARILWKEISNFYWRTLTQYVSRNTTGKREANEIIEKLNEKYVQQYFARRLTKKAVEHLNREAPEIQRLIENNIKEMTKSELENAATQIGAKKGTQEYQDILGRKSQALKDLIGEELMAMIEFGPAKVKPAFLKERGAQLPEYITITNKDGTKSTVKSYETGIDGTMGAYVGGMAKFLATVKHFPEFTDLKGKFGMGGEAKLKSLELLSKSNTMGAYAYETIKRQLGLDYSAKDVLMNPVLNYGGKLTNVSAVMGLSSPMSGLKNVLIQMPRSVAVFGAQNTMRSIAFAYKAMRDPKLMEAAMKRGELGYGVKEVIEQATGDIKTGPAIKWWFDNVNAMTITENFNRIVLAEAGRMHFTDLTNVARGSKSMFHPQGKPAEVQRMFKETWKLTDKEIDFIVNGKNVLESKRFQKILEKVGFESHKAGAGATGVSDLPLWMSGRYVKPFTLFMRMATSVTIDSYNNYVKPMQNGNLAPVLKATIGHGLSGAAMFWIYDKFMGQQVPTEESPAIDRMISYLWKGEALGMFGELIDPYGQQGISAPIMEPIIVRNAKTAWNEFSQVLGYGKGWDQALKDATMKTIVLAGQLDRVFNKVNHPYVSNTKRVRTLRNQFEKAMGYEKPQGQFLSERQPYYWKLKKEIMFGKSDRDISRAYYAAFNFICSDYENQGVTSKSMREKKARQAIDAVIRHMHPINMPDSKDGRRDSKRNEFLGWMSTDNKSLALKLEKEWKYKERAFYRIINNYKWKKQWSVYPS